MKVAGDVLKFDETCISVRLTFTCSAVTTAVATRMECVIRSTRDIAF